MSPGQEAYVADTKNSVYYVYAESVEGTPQLVWSGEHRLGPVHGGTELYGFLERKIATTVWGRWTQQLT
ncbi:MAG: hypothetical protein IT460_09935 [Planctomycetes bacterium]|nr:hypothetical protein [Planctomycetota bacterium]